MPVWAVALLEKMAMSVVLALLQKIGVVTAAEATGIKIGTHVLQAVESIKTYSEYPQDKNAPVGTPNNLAR